MYSIDKSMVREVLLRTSKTPASASQKKQISPSIGTKTCLKGDHGNHEIL